MSLYTPITLKRFYRKRINGKPERYSTLSAMLEMSRLKMTLSEMLSLALFYPLIATIPGLLLGYTVTQLIKPGDIILIRSIEIEYWKVQAVVCAGFALLAFGFTRYLILSYPLYLSNIRRGRIDAALPHTVNMMLGMAKGGLPLITIFKFVSENSKIFGEISKEFEKIVLLVEVFGYDMISAMRQVADTTPSEKLKTFFENFINVYEGGGDVVDYLKAKSDQFLTERETYYTLFFETLQVFAEIYLALFIVAPLFFLTVLVVFQLMGGTTLQLFKALMYTFIPIGSIFVMWLIKSAVPGEPSGFAEVKEDVERIHLSIDEKRRPGFTVNRFRLRLRAIKRFLLRPFTEEPYTLTLRALSFYLILPAAVFAAFAYGKMELDFLVFTSLSAIVLPAIIFIEYRDRIIHRMERELPEFLKQVASLNEAGLNVVEALRHLSETELGVLGREVRRIKREVEWGELITSALEKVESRIRSGIFAKAISMLIRAIESTPSIKDALLTASLYSELEIEMKDRMNAQMSMYTIIIYLSFAVFLYTAYVLIQNMLSIFTTLETTPVVNTAFDILEVKNTFLETSLMVAVFSGLMAGLMGEGKLNAGLKHVFTLVVIVYVFFKFILA